MVKFRQPDVNIGEFYNISSFFSFLPDTLMATKEAVFLHQGKTKEQGRQQKQDWGQLKEQQQ